MEDMMNKGRQNKRPGEKHHMSIFNDQEILDIRRLYKEGKLSQIKLGKIYQCSSVTIHNIVNRKTWKHI